MSRSTKDAASSHRGRNGRRIGWAVMFALAVALVVAGAVRDSGPRTPDERIQAISERIACPVCDGESVADSRASASLAIMERIKIDVREGQLTDDEIIESITSARMGQELLVPTSSGIDALAWALPAAAAAFATVALIAAFVRWRRMSDEVGTATDDDYALVEAAMSAKQKPDS